MIDEIKKWDYIELHNDTLSVFKTFNEIYSKNREAARYYIINNPLRSEILKVFNKKNIYVFIKEHVSYGVSISFKRYKSTKTIYKYYIDISNGLIAKCKNGKFLPCKPIDVEVSVKKFVIDKIPWIDFIFKLNLPVTFNTIIDKKLYSTKKLLSWYWSSNYPTAIKLNNLHDSQYKYLIRKHVKNIININNINKKLFDEEDSHLRLFINTLMLAVKLTKKINAVWSYNRLFTEYNNMNKIILNTLYENYNNTITIHDDFKPILNYLETKGYFIPKNYIELSKISNQEYHVSQIINKLSENKLIIFKGNNISIISKNSNYESTAVIAWPPGNWVGGVPTAGTDKFYISNNYNAYFIKDHENTLTTLVNSRNEIDQLIKNINNDYTNLLKIYNRKEKIKFLENKIS